MSEISRVRAFLIYPDMPNRKEMEEASEENPSKGLLFIDEVDVKKVFGVVYKGQVISDWRSSYERFIKTTKVKKYLDFYQYAKTLPYPNIRLCYLK